jgi:hypothetical protein
MKMDFCDIVEGLVHAVNYRIGALKLLSNFSSVFKLIWSLYIFFLNWTGKLGNLQLKFIEKKSNKIHKH